MSLTNPSPLAGSNHSSHQPTQSSFLSVPHEILTRILSLVPPKALLACSLVCKELNKIIADDVQLRPVLGEFYYALPPSLPRSPSFRPLKELDKIISREHNMSLLDPIKHHLIADKHARTIQSSGNTLLIVESTSGTLSRPYVMHNTSPDQVPSSWPRILDGWSLRHLHDDRGKSSPTRYAQVKPGEPIICTAISEVDNLLVVVTKLRNPISTIETTSYRFHLYSLHATQPESSPEEPTDWLPPRHPRAAFPFFDLVTPRRGDLDVYLEIGSDDRLMIGLNLKPYDHMVFVGVFGWRTACVFGQIPYIEQLPNRKCYAMVSGDYVICAVQEPDYRQRRRRRFVEERCRFIIYRLEASPDLKTSTAPEGGWVWVTPSLPHMRRQTTFEIPLFDLWGPISGEDLIHMLITSSLQVSQPASEEYSGGILYFDLSGRTLQSVHVQEGKVCRRPSWTTGSRGVILLPSFLRLVEEWADRVVPFHMWSSYVSFEPWDFPMSLTSLHGSKRLTIGGDKKLVQLISELNCNSPQVKFTLFDYNPSVVKEDAVDQAEIESAQSSTTGNSSSELAVPDVDSEGEADSEELVIDEGVKTRMDLLEWEVIDDQARVTRYRHDAIRCLGDLHSVERVGQLQISSTRDIRDVKFDGKRVIVLRYGKIDILYF